MFCVYVRLLNSTHLIECVISFIYTLFTSSLKAALNGAKARLISILPHLGDLVSVALFVIMKGVKAFGFLQDVFETST